MKKILGLIACVILLGGVLFLAVISYTQPWYIVPYGIACAFFPQLIFTIIGVLFVRDDKKVLRQLAKVPEIQSLINKATSTEERIKVLEEERKNLDEVINFEAKRRTLLAQKEIYEVEGNKVLNELSRIDGDLSILESQKNEKSEVTKKLLARIANEKDLVLVLGSRKIVFSEEFFYKRGILGFFIFKLVEGQLYSLNNLLRTLERLSVEMYSRRSRK